jgi:hypothetical protein
VYVTRNGILSVFFKLSFLYIWPFFWKEAMCLSFGLFSDPLYTAVLAQTIFIQNVWSNFCHAKIKYLFFL